MEQVLAQSLAPDELELNDVPPEVWAALCTAVPARGSTLNETISCSSLFAEARESIHSGTSSPMDTSPTNVATTPLFILGSSDEGQLSVSYHPQSIKTDTPPPHVIGNHLHLIMVSSASYGSNRESITRHLEHAQALLSVDNDRLTPSFQFPTESHNAALSLRSLINMQVMDRSLAPLTGTNCHYYQAEGAMHTIRDELNQAVEGHSHYFLREPLSIMEDLAFPVQSDELRHILDLAGAALSAGPRIDSDQDEIWRLLRPSNWYRAPTHTMAAGLRGAIQTKHVGRSENLPPIEMQCNLLEAMALQITEQLSLDNGPYMPQDSIDSIRATVWRAHEAQIRATVTAKANKVEECLTTMGLAELIDQMLNKASWEEITSTIKDDIALQGKAKAVAEALQTYAMVSAKLKDQKEHQAQKDADSYYNNLVEKAKEQACIKVDSEFAHLLADEHSAIAPRVDKEIKAEHSRIVEEWRLAMVAQLNTLTLEGEKKLVLAAAARLGMSIQNEEPAVKKIKVDQCKAQPAPVTPRGRSNSIASNTSARASSCK
ncbi:hypothetical protein V8E53_000797 [Lactarius tabidus]